MTEGSVRNESTEVARGPWIWMARDTAKRSMGGDFIPGYAFYTRKMKLNDSGFWVPAKKWNALMPFGWATTNIVYSILHVRFERGQEERGRVVFTPSDTKAARVRVSKHDDYTVRRLDGPKTCEDFCIILFQRLTGIILADGTYIDGDFHWEKQE